MNRNFYRFGIFLAVLYLGITFFHAIIQAQQGSRIFFLKAYLPWFFLVTIMNFAGLVIQAKYYHFRKYKAAFWVAMASGVVSLFYFVVIYHTITGNHLSAHYPVAYLLVLATGCVYASVLIFSNASERPWLKALGIYGLVLGIIQLSAFLLIINSQSFRLREVLGDAQLWIALVASLVLVPYIMNFRSELQAMEERSRPARTSNAAMILAMAVLLGVAFWCGFNLATDNRVGKLGQNKKASVEAERLALQFDARVYVNDRGDTLPYRLMKPLNYDPQQKYPLVVCLHHGGAHGTDNVIQVEGASYAQVLSTDANRAKYPAFIFVPQCPIGSTWGAIPHSPDVASQVFEAIAALEKEFVIDEKRRYVVGLSGGGFGSWHFIATRPEMFAAAIPICGGSDPELAKNMVNVPVWAFHGAEDKNVPVGFSRGMIKAIRDAGGDPKYTEFPGEGHNIWNKVIETPGVLDWLFDQRRD